MLEAVQSAFQTALMQDNPGALLPWVSAKGALPLTSCFNIYRNNFLETHIKALKSIYPVCYQLIGEDCFRGLCRLFLKQADFDERLLEKGGRGFPDWLSTYDHMHLTPYLPDVARLEWFVHERVNSPYVAPLSAPIPSQGSAQPKWFRQCAYLSTTYPIHTLWRQNQPGERLEEIVLDNETRWVIVYKQGWEVCIDTISGLEAELLNVIEDDAKLEAFIHQHFQEKLSAFIALLSSAIQKRWITLDSGEKRFAQG